VPRHGCTTVNLYDQFHVMRAGRLIDLWAVAGRGRSQ
jgi:D-serine deaminase-like pyridoxal phosphate-dependent protein